MTQLTIKQLFQPTEQVPSVPSFHLRRAEIRQGFSVLLWFGWSRSHSSQQNPWSKSTGSRKLAKEVACSPNTCPEWSQVSCLEELSTDYSVSENVRGASELWVFEGWSVCCHLWFSPNSSGEKKCNVADLFNHNCKYNYFDYLLWILNPEVFHLLPLTFMHLPTELPTEAKSTRYSLYIVFTFAPYNIITSDLKMRYFNYVFKAEALSYYWYTDIFCK